MAKLPAIAGWRNRKGLREVLTERDCRAELCYLGDATDRATVSSTRCVVSRLCFNSGGLFYLVVQIFERLLRLTSLASFALLAKHVSPAMS